MMKQLRLPLKPEFCKTTPEGINMYFCFTCDRYCHSDHFYRSCITRQIRRCKNCCKSVSKSSSTNRHVNPNPFNTALNKLRNDCRSMGKVIGNEWKINMNAHTTKWLVEWWNENTESDYAANNVTWVLWRPPPMMNEKNQTVQVNADDVVPFDKPLAKKLRQIPINLRRLAVSTEMADDIDQLLDQLSQEIGADSNST